MFSIATSGCKNPCEDEIDALKSRVSSFLADSDPLTEGEQPCITDPGHDEYDHICDFAEKALDTRWPYFDCNSCDATEIKLCSCYQDNVWVVSEEARQPTYPAVVYCLANYYRIRDLCACDPEYEKQHDGNCNLEGRMVKPGALEACGDGIDQNCDGFDPPCECADADFDGFRDVDCGGEDCNDGANWIFPGAPETLELCANQADENCDGVEMTCQCPDSDGDGFYSDACGGNDCDDTNEDIHPGARENCDDGVDDDCNGADLTCDCTDTDEDGTFSDTCGGNDCLDARFYRVCDIPIRAQITQHNLQQTDICDALLETFSCRFYDGDGDGIPDQYDGGQDRAAQYAAENPECLNGAPINSCLANRCQVGGQDCTYDRDCQAAAMWTEWFSTPRSLFDGGQIYMDADGDGDPDDTDRDGVADSCDNCIDARNGFDCTKVIEDQKPFEKQCDVNLDAVVSPEEFELGNQKDSNNDGIGDACDGDFDGMLNNIDNCPEHPNGYECSEAALELQCDVNLDGTLTDAELLLGEQKDTDDDGVGDACDNCVIVRNGYDCYDPQYEANCDRNEDGTVTETEKALGAQLDDNNNGIGDACE